MIFHPKQIEKGNVKLLELAAYVTRRHAAKPAKGYNQKSVNHSCGTPACLVGHGNVLHGGGVKTSAFILYHSRAAYALGTTEWMRLFSTIGCDDAGDDWRKAVAYVRAFVAERRRAATEQA